MGMCFKNNNNFTSGIVIPGSASWQNGAGSYGDTSSIISARPSPNNGAPSYNPGSQSYYWDGGKQNQGFGSFDAPKAQHSGQYGRSQGRNRNSLANGRVASPYSSTSLGRSWSIYNMNWGDSGSRSDLGRSSNGWDTSNSGSWGGRSANSGWDRSSSQRYNQDDSRFRASYGAGAQTSAGWNSRANKGWDSGSARSGNGWDSSGRSSNNWQGNGLGYKNNDPWQSSSW